MPTSRWVGVMHEFSIARNIVKTLISVAEEYDQEIVAATVAVGPMSMIVPELLTRAYEVLTNDTPLVGSELHVQQVPITAVCNECGAETESCQPFVECSECGSLNLKIKSGYELQLISAELRESDEIVPGV